MPTCPHCEYHSDDAGAFEFHGTGDESQFAIKMSRESKPEHVLVVCPDCDTVLGGGAYTA